MTRVDDGLGAVVVGIVVAALAESTISGVESDVLAAIGRVPDQVEQVVLGAARSPTTSPRCSWRRG